LPAAALKIACYCFFVCRQKEAGVIKSKGVYKNAGRRGRAAKKEALKQKGECRKCPEEDQQALSGAIEPLFYFMGSPKTTGKRAGDGKFIVFAGSCIDIAAPLSPAVQALRKRYPGAFNQDGILKEDIVFDSAGLIPAADRAFSFITGFTHYFGRNGFEEWETSDGKTLLEVCREDGYPIPAIYHDFN
jgi:hypothetical protein